MADNGPELGLNLSPIPSGTGLPPPAPGRLTSNLAVPGRTDTVKASMAGYGEDTRHREAAPQCPGRPPTGARNRRPNESQANDALTIEPEQSDVVAHGLSAVNKKAPN